MSRRMILPLERAKHYLDFQEEEEALRHCLAEMDERRLTVEEEHALSARALAGDTEAIWTLVLHNRKLVVSIATRYVGRGLSLLDLIQEGTLGLWEAAKRYDAAQFGTHFGTYATQWIRQAISRAIASKGQAIRVPDYVHVARGKLRRFESDGEGRNKEETMAALNLTERAYTHAKDAMHRVESLESSILGEEEGNTLRLADVLAAPAEGAKHALDPKQKEALHRLLQRLLTPQEYTAISKRFGLDGGEARKLREVGVEMDICRERVRQLEKSAMLKLRRIAPRLKDLLTA